MNIKSKYPALVILFEILFLIAFHLIASNSVDKQASILFESQASQYLQGIQDNLRLQQVKLRGISRFFRASTHVDESEFDEFAAEYVDLKETVAVCFRGKDGEFYQLPEAQLCAKLPLDESDSISYFPQDQLVLISHPVESSTNQNGVVYLWLNIHETFHLKKFSKISYFVGPYDELKSQVDLSDTSHYSYLNIKESLWPGYHVLFQSEVDQFRSELPKTHYLILFLIILVMCFFNLMIFSLSKREAVIEKKVLKQRKIIENQFRKIQEQQNLSLHSSRLASLGEMAAGIAHEINNPLAIINLTIQTIRKRMAKNANPEVITKLLNDLEVTVNRVSSIVGALRSVSRKSDGLIKEKVIFYTLINDLMALSQERLRSSSVELIWEGDLESSLSIDRVQISQVLINLISNAVDALEAAEEKWIKIIFEHNNNQAEIRVIDSGPGISNSIREKIFDPFFTTKDIGRGTGIGLSISRTILQKHGGELILDQSCSQTCFVLRLPA